MYSESIRASQLTLDIGTWVNDTRQHRDIQQTQQGRPSVGVAQHKSTPCLKRVLALRQLLDHVQMYAHDMALTEKRIVTITTRQKTDEKNAAPRRDEREAGSS